jgi:hypothetical protein
VVVLLPLFLAMDKGEFNNGGGGLMAAVVVAAMDKDKTMTKSGGGRQCNNQPMRKAAKAGDYW